MHANHLYFSKYSCGPSYTNFSQCVYIHVYMCVHVQCMNVFLYVQIVTCSDNNDLRVWYVIHIGCDVPTVPWLYMFVYTCISEKHELDFGDSASVFGCRPRTQLHVHVHVCP